VCYSLFSGRARSSLSGNVFFIRSVVCHFMGVRAETVSIRLLAGSVDVSAPSTKPNILVNTHDFSVTYPAYDSS